MRWHRQTQRNSPKKCDRKRHEKYPPPHTHTKKSHKNRFFSVLGSFAKYTPFTFLAFKDCKKYKKHHFRQYAVMLVYCTFVETIFVNSKIKCDKKCKHLPTVPVPYVLSSFRPLYNIINITYYKQTLHAHQRPNS
jgi:hypothetical protein